MRGFCEKKFSSMLISGTFTKAVMYLMLLSDSIIAGYFIGEAGVAGIKKADVLELSRQLVKSDRAYVPDPRNKEVYERNYGVFKRLYRSNASNFRRLNN